MNTESPPSVLLYSHNKRKHIYRPTLRLPTFHARTAQSAFATDWTEPKSRFDFQQK